jgi:hypothetical protein
MVCDIDFWSLQLDQTYRIPVPPDCGDGAAIVCWLLQVALKVCGVTYEMLSNCTVSPVGLDCSVMLHGVLLKLAVTDFGPFMVTEVGLAVPVASPLQDWNV